MCRLEKKTNTGTQKTPQQCQMSVRKLLRSAEKSHSYQNDETFFCSNLYRSVKNFTELCRSIENLNAGYVVLKSSFLVLYHWNWNAADVEYSLSWYEATLEACAVQCLYFCKLLEASFLEWHPSVSSN